MTEFLAFCCSPVWSVSSSSWFGTEQLLTLSSLAQDDKDARDSFNGSLLYSQAVKVPLVYFEIYH